MTHLNRIIFWGILLIPGLLLSQEKYPNFHHLDETDGLISNQVVYSMQDRDAYIWFATKSGLCKYDGYNFKNYTVQDSIARNDIRKVFQDSQGRIWIITRKQLSVWEKGKFRYPNEELEFIKDARIVDIVEDSSQTLWFTTPRQIVSLDKNNQHGQLEVFRTLEKGLRLRLVAISPKNEMYILYGNIFYKVKDKEIVREYPASYLDQRGLFKPQALLLRDGSLLYSSPTGLIHINSNGEESIFCQNFPIGFQPKNFKHIYEDEDANIWIADEKQGLLKINPQKSSLRTESFLQGISMQHIMQDFEGDFWFSSKNQGMYMLSRNADQIMSRQMEISYAMPELKWLENKTIVAMGHHTSGPLLIATEREIYQYSSQTGQPSLTLHSQVPLTGNDQIVDLLFLPKHKTLLRTQKKLMFYTDGAWVQVHQIGKPLALSLNSDEELLLYYEDSYQEDDDFLGIEMSLSLSPAQLEKLCDSAHAAGFIAKYKRQNKIVQSEPSTAFLLRDNASRIWGVSSNGLFKIDQPNGKDTFEIIHVFPAETHDLLSVSDSLLWVATNGSGIVIYNTNLRLQDPPNFLNKKRKKKLSVGAKIGRMQGEVCNVLYQDPNGHHIWVGTQTGLGRISEYDFSQNDAHIKWFDQKDGLNDNEVRAIHRYEKQLWIAGNTGLSIIDDAKIQEDYYDPPIYITAVYANPFQEEASFPYVFDHEKNNISVYYTGISYRNLGKLNFQYKLNDQDWMPVATNPIRFESLSTGEYDFQIRAISRDGLVSQEPAKIHFEILPLFYETWYFWALVLLSFGSLLLGIQRYIYSEQQRIILVDTVEARTHELNVKIEELHRSNQDLKQFAYVASHDLKTPLRTVIGHLQLLQKKLSKSLDQESENVMNFVVDNSKNMYVMINHLLDYSRLGRDSLEFEFFNLGDILTELTQSLQSVLVERNAQIHYDKFPEFMGVPEQWKILFQNLIENGIKFNASETPRIEIGYTDSPDFWILSVKDNGIGIKEEYQPKIFDLFQRLHTNEYPGSGIGLAKCKRIVELHGGSIWIDPILEGGTVFRFTVAKKLDR